jgi:hypothetical protein
LNPRARGERRRASSPAAALHGSRAGPRSGIAYGQRDGNQVRGNMPYAATHPARLMQRGYADARAKARQARPGRPLLTALWLYRPTSTTRLTLPRARLGVNAHYSSHFLSALSSLSLHLTLRVELYVGIQPLLAAASTLAVSASWPARLHLVSHSPQPHKKVSAMLWALAGRPAAAATVIYTRLRLTPLDPCPQAATTTTTTPSTHLPTHACWLLLARLLATRHGSSQRELW